MDIKTIDLYPLFENVDHWDRWKEYIPSHLTGHDHYMSPFEMDDDCGTCSGAKCDYCNRIYDDPIKCNGVPSDELEKWIKKNHPEVPADVVDDMVYNDYYRASKGGYRLGWCEWSDLKFEHPAKAIEILKHLYTEEELENDDWASAELIHIKNYMEKHPDRK